MHDDVLHGIEVMEAAVRSQQSGGPVRVACGLAACDTQEGAPVIEVRLG